MNKQQLFKYLLIMAIASVVAFFIHAFVLKLQDLPVFDHQIVWSYLLNLVLAGGILTLLFVFRNRLKQQLGFLFMGGSVIKFGCFFLFFYPLYKADGAISNAEFATFFIPYIICLFAETSSGIHLFNRLD